ncbi:MAG: DUF5103 domain-containing protein [Saprospiraceae bacterium]|nr:DUF5103 domain-containing protein [Saprospiraceae bacterium]
MLKNSLLIFLLFIFSLVDVTGQDFVNRDHTYLPSIRTVQLYIPGLQNIPAFAQLRQSGGSSNGFLGTNLLTALDSFVRDPSNPADYNPEVFYRDREGRFGTSSNYQQGGTLRLSFDDLATEARYLYYRFEHCNADWSKSDLEDFEFLSSINEQRIKNYEFSFNTRIPYVHYWVNFPNEDQTWTKSGNYLVHVYDSDTNEPILTRRLVVFEEEVSINAQLIRPFLVEDINTHHEISFEVDFTNTELKDILNNISATIIQNGRWDHAIIYQKPTHYAGNTIFFENLGAYKFPAGKEFRHFDIRSFDYPTRQVLEVSKEINGTEIKLVPDQPRGTSKFWSDRDLNGSFFIQSLDNYDSPVAADYAHILFSLQTPQPLLDEDVYIFGAFTNWELNDQYMMHYEDRYSAYFGEATLKQGVYDYLYAAVPRDKSYIDFDRLEGNWHETENFYTILVYYRPFGQRYDRLIGVQAISQK